MPKKPNYSYRFSVVDLDTQKEIAVMASRELPDVVQNIEANVQKWLANWEVDNLVQCYECQQMTTLDDISYPHVPGIEGAEVTEDARGVCQDCLSRILSGEQTPRE